VSAVSVRSTTVMRTGRRTLGRYTGMPAAKRYLEFHAVKDAETAPEAQHEAASAFSVLDVRDAFLVCLGDPGKAPDRVAHVAGKPGHGLFKALEADLMILVHRGQKLDAVCKGVHPVRQSVELFVGVHAFSPLIRL
jgi:hypothetical protein